MKIIAGFTIVLVFCFFVAADARMANERMPQNGIFFESAVEPELLSPSVKAVIEPGQKAIEFKWRTSAADLMKRAYFDFRLYKGYQTLASTLILKKEVQADSDSTAVDSGLFENDQIYTWTLKQIFKGGEKSDASYYSFRVKKP